MCQLSPVAFHGDTIFCVDHQGEPFVPMKPIVGNMGLAWQTQARKFLDNKERWGITMMMIPSDGGEQETICLPLRKLAAWLASINPKKVRQELRAKIELYQAESDDALWNYWINGKAEKRARAERRSQKRIEMQRRSLLGKPLPGPQPGDRYHAYLEKVEAWRVRTLAERERLLYEALALIEIEKTDAELHSSCAAYVRHWLETEALGPISVFHDCLESARAPITMIKRINESFASVLER